MTEGTELKNDAGSLFSGSMPRFAPDFRARRPEDR
ncbi:hypothetical protein ACVWYS_004054, partial [Arthrobacter sp. TE12231]